MYIRTRDHSDQLFLMNLCIYRLTIASIFMTLYMSTKAYMHKLFRKPDVITSTIDGLKGAEEVWEFP